MKIEGVAVVVLVVEVTGMGREKCTWMVSRGHGEEEGVYALTVLENDGKGLLLPPV